MKFTFSTDTSTGFVGHIFRKQHSFLKDTLPFQKSGLPEQSAKDGEKVWLL